MSQELEGAVEALRAGGLVAFPTETVYGLGADAANPRALGRLYAVKQRPASHPVIVHVAHAQQLDELARDVPDIARLLADQFWPGPLTLVVRRRSDKIAGEATGGRDTVGIRVPNHPLALALLDDFGGGVAAPSANRFGKVSPTTAQHVQADLDGDVDIILDGGPCAVGVESTIVDVTGVTPVLLRIGGVSEASLEACTGVRMARRVAGEIAAPGTLAKHYSPDARVEIVAPDAIAARRRELEAAGSRVVVLEAPRDLHEYARSLYTGLRNADARRADVVLATVPDEDSGLGSAIRDRLFRAAAG
jgi:L-threonylcarbamoyladenylate synthase